MINFSSFPETPSDKEERTDQHRHFRESQPRGAQQHVPAGTSSDWALSNLFRSCATRAQIPGSGASKHQDELVAATLLPDRTSQISRPAPVGQAQLQVRWDRVSVLFALLVVLAMVTAHAVISAVRDDPQTSAATQAATQAATPAVTQAATPAATQATTPATTPSPIQAANEPPKAEGPCPTPAKGVVRTAPAVSDQSDASRRTVALTFDDGPAPATPQVLDVLKRARVRATFFVVGQNAAANPEMLRRIIADGHALGDHSWSHHIPRSSVGWNRGKLTREIKHTRRVIIEATGLQPCVFRPPGGVVKGTQSVVRKAGLSMILWSVDTRDWAGSSHGEKFARVIRKRAALGLTEKHPVILLHDGGGNRSATVAALPGIIDDYRDRGYRFVTLHSRPSRPN
jgi:peptidoglycan/xylan/chitin deacetylase (PgdA/CDA1 family)